MVGLPSSELDSQPSRGVMGFRRDSVGERTKSDRFVVVAMPTARSLVGNACRAPYQRRRPTRLDDVARDAIRAAVDEGGTLRRLADDFGVSHETIRQVLRRRAA